MLESKKCSKCKEEKSINEFGKRSDNDSFRSQCRTCDSTSCQQRYAKNPERARALANARGKKYREQSAEKNIGKLRRYKTSNREKLAEAARNYRLSNPGKNAQSAKNWRTNNKDAVAAAKQSRRARERNAPGRFSKDEWAQLKDKFFYTCLACKEKEPDIELTPDHVIPLSKGGTNDISNIQPLCRECNCKKATNNTDYRKEINAVPPLMYQKVIEGLLS